MSFQHGNWIVWEFETPYTIVLSRLVCLNSNFLLCSQGSSRNSCLIKQRQLEGRVSKDYIGSSGRFAVWEPRLVIHRIMAIGQHLYMGHVWWESKCITRLVTSQKLTRVFKAAQQPPGNLSCCLHFLKVDVHVCQPSTPNVPTVGFSHQDTWWTSLPESPCEVAVLRLKPQCSCPAAARILAGPAWMATSRPPWEHSWSSNVATIRVWHLQVPVFSLPKKKTPFCANFFLEATLFPRRLFSSTGKFHVDPCLSWWSLAQGWHGSQVFADAVKAMSRAVPSKVRGAPNDADPPGRITKMGPNTWLP